MHSHETCEQLMAAARRSNNMGRLEYLAERCDRTHGRLLPDQRDPRAEVARAALTTTTEES